MKRVLLKKIMIVAIVSVVGMVMILVLDHISYAQSTKKVSGINFKVPDDWPIEKRGGIMAPIPIEEYISLKFKATEEEFQVIKTDFLKKFEKLQFDMENMEVNFSKELQKTKSQIMEQVGSGEDLLSIRTSLGRLESELVRLDRKIMSKVAKMRADPKKTTVLINSLEKKIKDLQSQIYDLDEKINFMFEQ